MEENFRLTNDILFQRVFGKVGNERITKLFLQKILGIQIEELELDTNKRLIGEMVDNKIGRVDVKARLSNGSKVIIEMQVARYKYMTKRMLYYWAETYVSDLKRGEEYKKIEKTIAILISVENLEELEGIEEYHTKWSIREEKHLNRKLTDDLEIHIIELNKFKEGQEARPEDNWIRAIKAKGGEELKKMSKLDKEIEELREELLRITADPTMREVYYQREKDLRDKLSFAEARMEEGLEQGRKEGKEEGIKEGKKEGIKEKQEEIIINMHKKKMDIKTIAEITNLNENEVKKIIDEG